MFEALEEHFSLLDNAPVSESSIFKTEVSKQRYETLLMYSFRKLQAAKYHFENVKSFIAKESESLNEIEPPSTGLEAKIRVTSSMKVSRRADEYVYELSAFLEALKSSLDLLAEVCSFYLAGMQTNYSISPLLKYVRKGNRGPILDEIAHNMDWLDTLRQYRHHLVHRLMPSLRTGHEVQLRGHKTAKVRYPVVVPEVTPSFIIDTRASQTEEMMAQESVNQFPGLTFGESMMTFTDADGNEHIEQFDLQVDPAEGYKRIDDFMNDHLNAYIAFSHQIMVAFTQLGFQFAPKSG